MARKKKLSPEDEQQVIADLRLMGYSWRDIERETGINYETARKRFSSSKKRIIKERTDFKMLEHIAAELARFDILIKEAWRGWLRSVGKMSKTAKEKGETPKGDVDKTITTRWSQAGDPRFLQVIKELMVERNRLVGAYEKDREDDDKIDLVRFEQSVYIPGVGELTPELMQSLIQSIEGQDDE